MVEDRTLACSVIFGRSIRKRPNSRCVDLLLVVLYFGRMQLMAGTTVSCTSCTSSYGMLGVEAWTNRPAGRWRAALAVDSSGYLWMHGGDLATAGGQVMSDLWYWPQLEMGNVSSCRRFHPATSYWTWCAVCVFVCHRVYSCVCRMSGSSSYNPTGAPLGRGAHGMVFVGGVLYVRTANNAICFTLSQTGFGILSSGNYVSDLWTYTISTKTWALINSQSGVYPSPPGSCVCLPSPLTNFAC